MAKRLVIFDCDGVLVDSETVGMEVLSHMLLQYGLNLSPQETLLRFRGYKIAECIVKIEAELGRALSPEFVVNFRQRSTEAFENRLTAIPNVGKIINALKEPSCVASNAPLAKIHHTLGITDLLKFFTGRIFSAYEVGSWKPDPGLFLHAASHFKITPSNCVVIEDSFPGICAAKAAGMEVFGYDPDNAAYEMRDVGCITFQSMLELPQLLSTWRDVIGSH